MQITTLIENKTAVPQAFNKIASRYDLATSMSQGYAADLDASVAGLRLRGDEYALDLCCGTGKSTRALLDRLPRGRVLGLDNSEGMLHEARRKFADEVKAGRAGFILRDAMDPGLAEGQFDIVFAAYGLRNMPDYPRFLANTHRLLKPGGQLCIHDYSLADTAWSKPYWTVLGYGFIVPFCTVMTGSSRIFTYLVQSVLAFPSPKSSERLRSDAGYGSVGSRPHKGWRGPILHTFTGVKA